jgi:hypothetical protein
LAGAAAGRTAEAGVRTARGFVRRERRVARGVGRDARALLAAARAAARALCSVAEAAVVGLASGLGSSSSLAIFAFVVLRGFGAG